MSVEVDILPIADDNDETARLADLIEGVAGEFSPFEELHGFTKARWHEGAEHPLTSWWTLRAISRLAVSRGRVRSDYRGFLATPATALPLRGSARSGGSHPESGARPGGIISRPSKNRMISSRLRGRICSAPDSL